MSETLFEKIINREIPADIIYEDDLSIVIKDIHPQALTHLLIIPKKVIPKLSDSSIEDQEVLGHLMLVAGKVAEQLNLITHLGLLSTMVQKQVKVSFTCIYIFYRVGL